MNPQDYFEMNLPSVRPRLAVLIDADNFPPWAIDRLWIEVETLGDPVIRRVYGNIAMNSKRWFELSTRLGLESRQRLVHSTGRNATDIVMVIEAMDILAGNHVDGFCLVSSDSDFTPLALRLRESDRQVFGFGGTTTPESFRTACSRFFPFSFRKPTAKAGEIVVLPQPPDRVVVPQLLDAVKSMDARDGWVTLSALSEHLANREPDFDLASYGVKTLKGLVHRTGCFEIGRAGGGGFQVRLKPDARPEGL